MHCLFDFLKKQRLRLLKFFFIYEDQPPIALTACMTAVTACMTAVTACMIDLTIPGAPTVAPPLAGQPPRRPSVEVEAGVLVAIVEAHGVEARVEAGGQVSTARGCS